MTPGGYIILTFVLIGLILQIVQIVRTDRSNRRIDLIDARVTRIEGAFTTGQVDHASVVSFRAELASKLNEQMTPVHQHLAAQDRKLDEIKAALKDWAETRRTRAS